MYQVPGLIYESCSVSILGGGGHNKATAAEFPGALWSGLPQWSCLEQTAVGSVSVKKCHSSREVPHLLGRMCIFSPFTSVQTCQRMTVIYLVLLWDSGKQQLHILWHQWSNFPS